MIFSLPFGAAPAADSTSFRVWAASASQVDVVIYQDGRPAATHPMRAAPGGFFEARVPGVGHGARYMYRLNGADDRPDPASRSQPEGVHGPSEVVDPARHAWGDVGWRGIPIEQAVIYELHTGTFTPEGTFDSAIPRLAALRDLGVTAIEIMPVADFPGQRGWGYDGVSLFAPSRAYGGPDALRRLVDAAHQQGLAVILDVVYNHLGPDGNYLRQFAEHYFTHHHSTPWGDALNFDDVASEHVRGFFVANACYWAAEFHLDGLRLDATHAIQDDSPTHILAEIAASVRAIQPPGRHFILIAEDERNQPSLIRPPAQGGYGLDAAWADDFHHQLRVALTGEREGYYADYTGSAQDLAATMRQGWFYTGQRSAAMGHPRGQPADGCPPSAFVYCIQNHDQVGNRAFGERLGHMVPPEAYRMASALLLLAPHTPMLWQGQEWDASTPFLYFTDHHAELGRLVTEGRRREFERFAAFAGEQVPDPQADETFLRSKLRWAERGQPRHAQTLALYRDLLALRQQLPRGSFQAEALGPDTLALHRSGGHELLLLANLRGASRHPLDGQWQQLLSTEDARYGGAGAATLAQGAASFDGPAALLLRRVG